MMAYSMISHILILLVVSTASAHYITNSTDAFHDVLHFVNGPFSVETKLNAESLEEIYHELFEKGDCEDNSANCSICIDGFRNMTAAEITSIDEWNDVSTCLLYALLDMSAFCQLTFDERSNLDCEDALLDALNATDSTVIGEEEYHMFLHALEHHFSGGEEHHDEHEGEEEHHDEDEEEEEHDDHDHEEEGHHESTRCFGEGTLLYHLGLDHEEELPLSELPVVSGVLIAFLAQDMIVNEACAVEPSQTDILKDLFSAIGDGDAISEEGFESLLETLALGSIPGATVEEEEEEGHEGHDHKRSIRKRALSYQRLNKRSADDEPAVTAQCMSEATLASVYGLDLEDGISKTQFLQLCPALIQQKVGGHCDPPAATTAPPVTAPEATQAQVYGYGVLAVIIISLTAVAGAFLIPFLHKQVIMYVLDLFVAMGVSTMLADALLHLLPQALGLHDHGAHEEHADEGVHVAEYTIVQVVACISIYAFFIFESVMSKLRPRSDVAPGHGHSHAIDMGRDNKAMEGDAEDTGSSSKDAWGNKKENDGDTDSETKKPGIAPLALMILVGDGIHNFIDGLALGAAFTSSLQEGLGTSIAIFCHELPHELGDFSILIQSGMSKGKAILFNLLSASTCLIGLFVGIALGADEKIRTYLIALTAGMFIYIALTDMLPSLMTPRKEGKWWIYFLLQNIGIIMGISLMLVISVYEEQLIHMD